MEPIEDEILSNHDLLVDKVNLDNDLICTICCCLLVDNRQGCSEGHVFCFKCINNWLTKSKSCPICRNEIKSCDYLSKNRFMEREIEKLNIYCPYKFGINNLHVDDSEGCSQIISIGDKKLHLEKCKFKFVKCENNGCNLKVRLNQLEYHKNDECEFTLILCKNEGCNLEFVKSKIITHQDEECPFGLVPCTNESCNEMVQKYLYNDHKDIDCKYELVDCEYKNYGCLVRFQRGDIDDHYSIINHTLFKIIGNQNLLLSKTIQELTNLKNENNRQTLLLSSTMEEISNLKIEYNDSMLLINKQSLLLTESEKKLSYTMSQLSILKKEYDNITKVFEEGIMSTLEKELIKSEINNPPLYELGQEWAVINKEWFLKWESGKFLRNQLGPIDNSSLIENGELKPTVFEEIHFKLVKKSIWLKLCNVYGGGPEIIRKVVKYGIKLVVEIPIKLKFFKSSDVNTKIEGVAYMYERNSDLKKRACKIFNLNPENIKIWDYYKGKKDREIYNLNYTVFESVHLIVNQLILLEEKLPNGDWP